MILTLSVCAAVSALAAEQTPAGKLAPRPLFRDPPFDAPTDPVLCFNAEAQKWFMYYTARRATATNTPGVTCTVLGSTNPALPLATWYVLGVATEISPGQYQFTDLQATNSLQRCYRVRSP